MFLSKKTGGATIGAYEWAEDGAITEVPDELGGELLLLAPNEYTEVRDDPEPDTETDPNADPDAVKRPNLAASAEEWKTYALAQGLPAETVEAATRKAVVDHFNGGPELAPETP